MPNTKSAQKALRQSKKRRERNLRRIGSYKNAVKRFKKLVSESNFNEAKKLLPTVFKNLDKASKIGVIKRNKASRIKSRTSKLIASK